MTDDVDDLILKMQHLEAAAREAEKARALAGDTGRLRTQLQKLAARSQAELSTAERDQADAAEKVARGHTPGLSPLEAADLIAGGRDLLAEAKTRAVKARARLNYALDQMDEIERREWEALQAEARAEAHAQLAESGDDSAHGGAIPRASASSAGASSTAAPATPGGANEPEKP